jgi:ATP-dependent Lon protease
VLPRLQAAVDGCQEVILPKENERDVQMTPDHVRTKINVRFVSSLEEVLEAALLKASTALASSPRAWG